MTENVFQFIKDIFPQLMGVGLGFGLFLGFFVMLAGYSLGKVQSMIGSND